MAERQQVPPLFWRLLSRLLPPDFRALWAQEVWRAHVDASGGAAHAGGFGFWRRLIVDVVITAVRVRMDIVPVVVNGARSRVNMPDSLGYHMRHVVRGLVRSPGFSVSVMLTLALGLGANATIFTLQPVSVVSRAMALRLWHNEEAALGKCVIVKGNDPVQDGTGACSTVIGVAGDLQPSIQQPEPMMSFWVPPRHPGIGFDAGQLVIIRLARNAAAALPAILQDARAASADIRYIHAETLGASVETQLRAWRLGAFLLSAFGLLALFVAASGLYCIHAFDVAQRHFELSVRAALGATAPRLVRAVVAQMLLKLASVSASAHLLLFRWHGCLDPCSSAFSPTTPSAIWVRW